MVPAPMMYPLRRYLVVIYIRRREDEHQGGEHTHAHKHKQVGSGKGFAVTDGHTAVVTDLMVGKSWQFIHLLILLFYLCHI